MGLTGYNDVQDQMQKFWSPLSASQLVQSNPYLNVVNRNYEGQLSRKGDTVYVNVINPMTAEVRTAGVDADTFDTQKVQMTRTAIKADKLFSVAVELEDLVQLQSLLDSGDMKLRESMTQALADKISAYLYGFRKTTLTDGVTVDSGVATLSKTEFRGARVFGGKKKWPKDGNWFAFLDPEYWGDISVDSTLASVDFVGETPIAAQSSFRKLLDFNTTEDNSLGSKQGFFMHREWLYYVQQTAPTWKISDLHATKKNGVLLSCQIVGGAAKNQYAGDDLHYLVYNSSWVDPS
jgi:hypothetical protein